MKRLTFGTENHGKKRTSLCFFIYLFINFNFFLGGGGGGQKHHLGPPTPSPLTGHF